MSEMVHPPASLESQTRTASLRSWLTVGAALLMTLAMTSIATAWTPTTPPVGVATFGSTGSDMAMGTAINASGNIIVAGYFTGTVDFDPGSGVSTMTSAGSDDGFVATLDSAGELLWSLQFGSLTSDRANSVTVDASGNIIVAGYFTGSVDFDPGSGVSTLTSVGEYDAFVLKLTGTGDLVWVRALAGTYSDIANAVTTDVSGNVYTTGSFKQNIDLNPGAGTNVRYAVGTAQTEVFISKLD
ncbi:MAG: hypothetical protein EBY80_15100, partial [Actinobacteria bacterium]|nr:hypothetical protein [Actinomycetota bacterium]